MKTLLKLCIVFGLALGVVGLARGHWQDQPPHQMAQLGELKLEGGGMIPNLKMSCVTHGKLNRTSALDPGAARARGPATIAMPHGRSGRPIRSSPRGVLVA